MKKTKNTCKYEGTNISQLLTLNSYQVTLLTDNQPIKSTILQSLQTPSILHFATHGNAVVDPAKHVLEIFMGGSVVLTHPKGEEKFF